MRVLAVLKAADLDADAFDVDRHQVGIALRQEMWRC